MSETVYVKVIRVRMQVGGFTKNPKAVNTQNNILVDLTDHPQKDEVQKDWYYDEVTNTFSPNGEIIYPEPTEPELTEAELVQAELLLNQAEILAKQNEQDEVLAEILLSQLEV